MVGDPEVLGKNPLWRSFLNYIRLREGTTGKQPSWKANEPANVIGYEIIPRPGGVVYGEEFIDGKSREIYRYYLND
jgi:helicase MOV-10